MHGISSHHMHKIRFCRSIQTFVFRLSVGQSDLLPMVVPILTGHCFGMDLILAEGTPGTMVCPTTDPNTNGDEYVWHGT